MLKRNINGTEHDLKELWVERTYGTYDKLHDVFTHGQDTLVIAAPPSPGRDNSVIVGRLSLY